MTIPEEISNPIKTFVKKYWICGIFLFVAFLIGEISVYFLGKNNPIELEIEKVIEDEIGVKIDLTP